MPTATVQFDLEPEAAKLFREASEDARKRISVLFSALITQEAKHPRSLDEVMDEMSRRAAGRGLTEKELNDLLHE
jgi:rubrerythrin